jgi:hypothetical protein
LKINKSHQGKEFKSYFRFIGQVKQSITGTSENFVVQPLFQTTLTKTNKPRRVLRFDVLTNKFNNIAVSLAGMEKEFVYLYSSTDKKSEKIKWADRLDKTKYPNESYHYILSEWDLSQSIADSLNENDWVEVKGKYEFSTFTNEEGKEYPVIKRIITSVEPVENGQEVALRNKTKINYITDFDSPEFVEVNYFGLEVGIKSVYQDEETKDVIVNGVFLDYGKEKSTPRDVKLSVPYKEASKGKTSLADAFAKLNEYDFLDVVGIDNNRPVFTEVEVEASEDDAFADVEETVAQTQRVISGNKKGLEIIAVVKNSLQKGLLTQEEFEPTVEQTFSGNEVNNDDEIPFSDADMPEWLREDKED